MCLLTFQFAIVYQKRIIGFSGRVARHLTVTRTAVGALLFQYVMTTVRCVRHYDHGMDTS